MRGKLKNSGANIESIRITPAHAGKTKVKRGTIDRYGDHPRACGENNLLNWVKSLLSGSPPRMRGKPFQTFLLFRYMRITPAHAGKTTAASGRGLAAKDHPRACGENELRMLAEAIDIGSPPRMRGKLNPIGSFDSQRRITPAHAGKTLEGPRRGSRKKDHPRACGENDAFPIFAPHSIGSPPRMRGKLTHDNCRVYLPRITPAHAGKT